MIASLIALLIVAFLVRLVPALSTRNLGVDHWYWLLYIEELKRQKTFPIKLPYLLDRGQWYPPLFPRALSFLPAGWLKKHGRVVAPVFDALHVVPAFIGVWYVTGDLTASVLSGMAVLVVPICIDYNYQLNPRAVGAILLATQMLVLHEALQSSQAWHWAWLVSAGAMICLLHKMTTQMMGFALIGFGGVYESWTPIVVLPTSMAGAWLLSRGFYTRVLIAHWDIVRFWNRHWPDLNAHAYHNSPIYATETVVDTRYHRPGIVGLVLHTRNIVAANPFGIVPIAVVSDPSLSQTPLMEFCLVWTAIVYLWAFLTSLVPWLKSLGAGQLYVYNGVLPCALLAGLAASSVWVQAALAAAALASSLAIYKAVLRRRRKGAQDRRDFLGGVLDHLAEQPDGNVFCIPLAISDRTTYHTRKQTVWGAHGYGLDDVDPIFPVMKIRLQEAFTAYDVKYLVVDSRYFDIDAVDEQWQKRELFSSGPYVLHEVEPIVQEQTMPDLEGTLA